MTRRGPDPNIIDVEASGFGAQSYPIEIGVALSSGQRWCSLITPPAHWSHWSAEAEGVHNVSRDTLLRHGKPIARVCEELNTLLRGQTAYSDGWVVDRPWLTKLFTQARISMAFDVSPLERILSEAQMEIWHATKERLAARSGEARHRASSDAWLIQKTFNETLSRTCDAESRAESSKQ
jgi:hypothetical protein